MGILLADSVAGPLRSPGLGLVRQAPVTPGEAAAFAARVAGMAGVPGTVVVPLGPQGPQGVRVEADPSGPQLVLLQPLVPELAGCRWVLAAGPSGTYTATAACPEALGDPATLFDAAVAVLAGMPAEVPEDTHYGDAEASGDYFGKS